MIIIWRMVLLGMLAISAMTHASVITLETAIDLAVQNNRNLSVHAKQVEASGYGIRQAGKLPNPELEVENAWESVGARLMQPVELGGKRAARKRLARADSSKASAEYVAALANLKAETMRRFYLGLGAKKEIELVDSTITLAEGTLAAVEKHVDAGMTGAFEALRIRNDIVALQNEKMKLEREYGNSVIKLASLWGDLRPDVHWELQGELENNLHSWPQEELVGKIAVAPEIAIANAEAVAARAEEILARSERFQDAGIGAGYFRNNQEKSNTVGVFAGLGLPLFNRNKHGVAAAKRQAEAAELRAKSMHDIVTARLMEINNTLESLVESARTLREDLLPRSKRICAELLRMYHAGKVSYLDIHTAQRELLIFQREYGNTLVAIHLAQADIKEIIGAENY